MQRHDSRYDSSSKCKCIKADNECEQSSAIGAHVFKYACDEKIIDEPSEGRFV